MIGETLNVKFNIALCFPEEVDVKINILLKTREPHQIANDKAQKSEIYPECKKGMAKTGGNAQRGVLRLVQRISFGIGPKNQQVGLVQRIY